MPSFVKHDSTAWDVVVRLHKIVFLLDRRAHLLVRRRLGLTYSQFMIVMALKHRGQVSQNVLAEASGLTAAAISRKISGLAAKGIVRFQINPANRREHVLTLTSTGTRAAAQAQSVLGRAFHDVFRHLSGRQQAALDQGLRALLDTICQKIGTIKRLPSLENAE